MERKPAWSDVEKGKLLAYQNEGLSSREIARRIDLFLLVMNNFLKHGPEYGTKKSPGRTCKLTPRQERLVTRELTSECRWNFPGKVNSTSQP